MVALAWLINFDRYDTAALRRRRHVEQCTPVGLTRPIIPEKDVTASAVP